MGGNGRPPAQPAEPALLLGPVFLVKLLSGHVWFLIRFLPGRGNISCSRTAQPGDP